MEVVAELLLDCHVLQLKGDVEYHRVVVLPVDDQVHVESLVTRLVVGEDRQMEDVLGGWLRLAGWLKPDHQQVVLEHMPCSRGELLVIVFMSRILTPWITTD